MRVKFKSGEQRKFLELVVEKLNCVSIRGILERGFDIKYNSLKSYYTERRLLPEEFFRDLYTELGKSYAKNIIGLDDDKIKARKVLR